MTASDRTTSATSSRSRRHMRTLTLLVAVPIVIALLGLVWWLRVNRVPDSARAMQGLLAALETSDVAGALAFLDASPPPGTEPLLSDQALAGRAGGFAHNPNLVNVGTRSAPAYQASVEIGGVSRVVLWRVAKIDGRWLVEADDVLSAVAIDPTAPHVINGVPIPDNTPQVLTLPGDYSVATGLPLLGFPPDQTSFTRYTGGAYSFDADLVVLPDVGDQVVDQVRALLAGCVAERSAPTSCGWPLVFTNGSVLDGTIDWRLNPADPAAGITVPTAGLGSDTGYRATITLHYVTTASGEGILEDGSVGTFADYSVERLTTLVVDLSGTEPVVEPG